MKRIIVDLRDDSLQVLESATEEDGPDAVNGPSTEVLEARERYRAFWTSFFQKLQLDDKSFEVSEPARNQNQYFMLRKETQAWVSAYLAPSKNQAGVYLTFYKGPIGDRIYSALEADKDNIDRELGVPARWVSDGRKHSITTVQTCSASAVDDHVESLQRTLGDSTNRYINAFKPRLEKLVVVVELNAFLHDDGESASCAGSWQRLDLEVTNATVRRTGADGAWVLDGSIRIDEAVIENMAPIDLHRVGEVVVTLTGNDFELTVEGLSVRLRVAGAPGERESQ